MASGGNIRITGLRETARKLERLGTSVQDLKAAFKRVGEVVRSEALILVPKRSGALASTIRLSNTKNKSVIRAGARLPYAGVIHYGGYNNITPNPFLETAVGNKQSEVVSTLDDELGKLIRQLDLN